MLHFSRTAPEKRCRVVAGRRDAETSPRSETRFLLNCFQPVSCFPPHQRRASSQRQRQQQRRQRRQSRLIYCTLQPLDIKRSLVTRNSLSQRSSKTTKCDFIVSIVSIRKKKRKKSKRSLCLPVRRLDMIGCRLPGAPSDTRLTTGGQNHVDHEKMRFTRENRRSSIEGTL